MKKKIKRTAFQPTGDLQPVLCVKCNICCTSVWILVMLLYKGIKTIYPQVVYNPFSEFSSS